MSDLSLSSCPCGKDVKFTRINGDYGYTPDYISLKCCGVKFSHVAERWDPGVGTYDIEVEAKAKIAARWNRRVFVIQKALNLGLTKKEIDIIAR